MSLTFAQEAPPLAMDEFGIVRVAGTRVTLDTILGAFNRGQTAAQIAQDYDAVGLSDIYAAIGFYLRHLEEVDAYLAQGKRDSSEVRKSNERAFPSAGIRERLLARQRPKPVAES